MTFRKISCITFLSSILILLCFLPLFAFQGNVEFNQVMVGEGLKQNYINKTIQDKQSFIWFATFDGLCRYDGYDVIRYKHDPDDLNSLSSDSV
ncbi:MAG: hypothetical protein GY863_18720, partial [bacterium]|nr:hypothetical protein [bacterium]